MVLPDPKLPGTDKDIIVWLDASFSSRSEEEATQRAAVAALQAVAGERSLDYVLPQVWPLPARHMLSSCGDSVSWTSTANMHAMTAATLMLCNQKHFKRTLQQP